MQAMTSPPPAPHPPPPAGPYSRFSPGHSLHGQGGPPPGAPPPPGLAPPGGPPMRPGSVPGSSVASARPFSAGLPPGTPAPMQPLPSGVGGPQPAPNAFYPPGVGAPTVGRKRIIVCCDGTWLNSDNMLRGGELELPSNVTRLTRAIKAKSADGIPQVVFYQQGVGAEGGMVMRILGGIAAKGLGENIREAYVFVANNYNPGDEIFCIGFSRGAFTARSLVGVMDAIGLLTKAGLASWGVIYQDVRHRYDKNWQSAYPNVPFQNKPGVGDPGYAQELQRRGLTRLNIPVKAIGVFDTVGSLGIPRVPWLERFGLAPRTRSEYRFYDTQLSDLVENAFQALALDEQRASFEPALWEKRPTNHTNLRQVWFPGVHSNVGGGYADLDLANITLAWMIAQLEPFLDFDPEYIRGQFQQAASYYEQTGQDPRLWSFGEVYNSLMGVYGLGGKIIRTPGMYMRPDHLTGAPTRKGLRDTYEYVHPSVRSRLKMHGPGVQDRGEYEAEALRDYRLRTTNSAPGENRPLAVWESKSKRKGAPRRVLNESPLWETELKLLRHSGRVYDFLLDEPRRPHRGGGQRDQGEE